MPPCTLCSQICSLITTLIKTALLLLLHLPSVLRPLELKRALGDTNVRLLIAFTFLH